MSSSQGHGILPPSATIEHARSTLYRTLPQDGLGMDAVSHHLHQDIAPALNKASRSANYYGFVTGGATPAASLADNIVTEYDNSAQVHLPKETIATDVEDAALRMLCDMVGLPTEQWPHRTFTTGATASNILGLACGRQHAIHQAARSKDLEANVAHLGIFEAMKTAGIEGIQILTTAPHSSLKKAASIVGLGRSSVTEISLFQAKHKFDFNLLEKLLSRLKIASIVAVSCAEVNTGLFATAGDDMQRIRSLCDKHGAWLHVDAAFGLQARILSPLDPMYKSVTEGVRGLELADSIAGDAHKLLNVPYDCGIFLSRHLDLATEVFQNVGAAYLTSDPAASIPSPLNIGIENSRRFRALPVYATLAAYGREGHQTTLKNQIGLARAIADFLDRTPGFELLPKYPPSYDRPAEQGLSRIYIVVLFRATDDAINQELVQRINGTRKIYVSATQWDQKPAARFAVSNWQVDVERDIALIKEVLLEILRK